MSTTIEKEAREIWNHNKKVELEKENAENIKIYNAIRKFFPTFKAKEEGGRSRRSLCGLKTMGWHDVFVLHNLRIRRDGYHPENSTALCVCIKCGGMGQVWHNFSHGWWLPGDCMIGYINPNVEHLTKEIPYTII
jgi:hypothetical protein